MTFRKEPSRLGIIKVQFGKISQSYLYAFEYCKTPEMKLPQHCSTKEKTISLFEVKHERETLLSCKEYPSMPCRAWLCATTLIRKTNSNRNKTTNAQTKPSSPRRFHHYMPTKISRIIISFLLPFSRLFTNPHYVLRSNVHFPSTQSTRKGRSNTPPID